MPLSRASKAFSVILLVLVGGILGTLETIQASDRDASTIEVLKHEWHPGAVWERIGKTQFFWSATVRNNSDIRKRVYVYYDLLDARDVPLARNVKNQYIDRNQTVDVLSDSYILSDDLPWVKSSRVTVKVGSP